MFTCCKCKARIAEIRILSRQSVDFYSAINGTGNPKMSAEVMGLELMLQSLLELRRWNYVGINCLREIFMKI